MLPAHRVTPRGGRVAHRLGRVLVRVLRAGHEVVVYDNLSNGHAKFAKWGPLEEGDIRDAARLGEVFAVHRPDAVLHCAALIEVGELVKFPERFHDVNVRGTQTLLDAMGAGVPIVASVRNTRL